MKAEEKWNNHVIEVLDREHGKKVIEWWNEQGVKTGFLFGSGTKEANSSWRYCGLLNGSFNNYDIDYVTAYKAKIITLPEPFPEKWYMVLNDENREIALGWRDSVCGDAWKGWGACFLLSKHLQDNSFTYGELFLDHKESKGYSDYQEITFQQFLDNVYKPKQSNKMKITSEQAQQIIDMVSPSCKWKERLLDLWAKSIVLKQEIYVDDSLCKEGYKDASESQKKVLDGIFGKYLEIDLTKETGIGKRKLFLKDGIDSDCLISVYGKNTFWLSDYFKFTIYENYLIVEPK